MADALPLRGFVRIGAVLLCATLAVVVARPPDAAAQQASPAATGQAAKKTTRPAARKPKTAKPPPPAKQDPVEAQRMLAAGQTALVSGKPDAAVENLNSALAGRALSSNDMAKALYLRGAAYRKLSKPALAIADLNGALYIRKGLNDVDRKDADEQRAAAYREAGLPDQRVASVAPALASEPQAPLGAPRTTASLPAAAAAAATVPAAAAQPSAPAGSGAGPLGEIGTFFGSLFGNSASASKAPAAPEPGPAPVPQNAVSSWSTSTKVGASPTQPALNRVAVAPTPATAPTATPPAQAILMQLANLRDRAEAEALAQRVRQEYAADLGARTVVVAENVAGSFGRLHAVRVGPFASADESRALCTRFRKQGLDCLAIGEK